MIIGTLHLQSKLVNRAFKKDRINGNEFDSKPPNGHSDAFDQGYGRGYDDG